MIKKCIGCIIYDSSTGLFLLQQRSKKSSFGLKWGFWGGKLEEGETNIDALRREIMEELNIVISLDNVKPLDIYVSEDGTFVYSSFLIILDHTPEIKIDANETNAYVWLPLTSLVKIDLHPGTKYAIDRKYHILEQAVSKRN